MSWAFYTPLSNKSDMTKSKMSLDITFFCDFSDKPILSHHDDIIMFSFSTMEKILGASKNTKFSCVHKF